MTTKEIISVLSVLLLAAALRLSGITFDSLWLDESYQTFTETVAQPLPDFTKAPSAPFLFKFGPPQSVGTLLANFRKVDPLCPPLYAILLNRWMTAFGQSDFAARSLSTLFSMLSLLILYLSSRYFFGWLPALFTALLVAVSPFDIHYAQEARMYGLLLFTSTLSGTTLLMLCSRVLAGRSVNLAQPAADGQKGEVEIAQSHNDATGGSPKNAPEEKSGSAFEFALLAVVYAVSTWALINSHYTALFVVLFQGLYGLWICLRHRSLKLFLILTCAWSAVLILWLPWFDLFRQSAAARTESFYVIRQPSFWWPFWALIARIPFNWLVFLSGKQVVAYAIPIYITSAVLLAAASPLARKLKSSTESSQHLSFCKQFIWMWALMPPLMVWLIDVVEGHKVVEIARYLTATAPAIYLLSGYGMSALTVVRRWGPVLLAVHVSCAFINNAYGHMLAQREPWKEMAALVESQVQPDEPLLVSQYYDIVCLDRYLSVPRLQFGVSPALGAEHLAGLLSGHKRFWLITAQEGEAIKHMIPKHFRLSRQTDLRHALHLRLYETP